MFPSQGNLYVAPFMDDALYMEHYSKANFWYKVHFCLPYLVDSFPNIYLRREVMFSPLFVCLSVARISQKVLPTQ